MDYFSQSLNFFKTLHKLAKKRNQTAKVRNKNDRKRHLPLRPLLRPQQSHLRRRNCLARQNLPRQIQTAHHPRTFRRLPSHPPRQEPPHHRLTRPRPCRWPPPLLPLRPIHHRRTYQENAGHRRGPLLHVLPLRQQSPRPGAPPRPLA